MLKRGITMRKIVTNAVVAAILLSTTVTVPTAATAQTQRDIMIENQCYKPLRIWISHADGWRNWHGHGPFDFSGNEPAIRIRANGRILTQRDDHRLYIYGETLDGSEIWDGDFPNTVNGVSYNMREVNYSVDRGTYYVSFTC